VIVIHATLLVAVHAHVAADAVTARLPVPPAAAKLADVGKISYVQGGVTCPPACVTVCVCPAIVSVPVRGVVAGFAGTENDTAPEPVPDCPASMVIQAALLLAVHVHVAAVVTRTSPVARVPGNDVDVELSM
jgi:hypothetical protein